MVKIPLKPRAEAGAVGARIEALVDRILEATTMQQGNQGQDITPKQDIQALEDELNAAVYALYGLSADEIAQITNEE